MAPTPRTIAIVLFLVIFGSSSVLYAESAPRFSHFDNYAPSVQTDIAFSSSQLAWLNQVFNLMGSKDFTFVYRVDSDHWIGLYRERLSMVVHIHNSDAPFNFRARVNRKTGVMDVLRGVSYKGLSKAESAQAAAQIAKGYLQRVLANSDIFGMGMIAGNAAAMSPMAQPDHMQPTKPMSSSDSAAAHDSAPMKADDSMAADSMSQDSMTAADTAPMAANSPMGTMPDDPLSRLLTGNSRFVSGHLKHPNQTPESREMVAEAQHPFAVVVTCSDSRLSPEIVFDQGLGDIFVIRTAGEVVGDYELGSIEYAVEHLHVTYILVLGHSRCGAVEATIKGGDVSDNIARIEQQIRPAVEAVQGKPGNFLDNVIRQQSKNTVAKIETSPVVRELMQEKKLTINAGYYNLDSGVVSILE